MSLYIFIPLSYVVVFFVVIRGYLLVQWCVDRSVILLYFDHNSCYFYKFSFLGSLNVCSFPLEIKPSIFLHLLTSDPDDPIGVQFYVGVTADGTIRFEGISLIHVSLYIFIPLSSVVVFLVAQ